mgnify:FL=1
MFSIVQFRSIGANVQHAGNLVENVLESITQWEKQKTKLNMKVIETFVVIVNGKTKIIFKCAEDCYYISDNGAFGQRDTCFEFIPTSIALKYIDDMANHIQKINNP